MKEVQVQEVNENDYVNVLGVATDDIEECVCSKCGVTYFRAVKGRKQSKSFCKKCFYDNIRKTLPYTIENGVATFTTTNGDTFIVDEEDCERVAKYNWYVNGSGYIKATINSKTVCLHRFIFGLTPEDKVLVDHINHDTKDNRKENLRICSRQENNRNKDSKGYHKRRNGSYQAYIVVDKKTINLGHFATKEHAKAVRIMAEKEYFGQYSNNVHLFNDTEILRLYEEAMASIEYIHKNEVRIEDDVVYVTVSSKGITKEFVVDVIDYDKIKNYKWCIGNRGCIMTTVNSEQQTLARVLLGLEKGEKKRVTFVDGDTLNYRRENLKIIELKTKNQE